MIYQNCNTGDYTATLKLDPSYETGVLHMERDPNTLMSTGEAAEELGLTNGYIRRLIRIKELRAQKIGGRWLVRLGDLDAIRNRPKVGRPPKDKP